MRTLRGAGVVLSDRRVVRSQRLVQAAALLAGRTQATGSDIWPLLFAAPTAEAQRTARQALPDLVSAARSELLPHAVAAVSDGPAALAGRRVAVVHNYAIGKRIREENPELVAHLVETPLEALQALAAGVAARRINISLETIVCLNKCHFGPSMRLAPGGRFILGKTIEDVPALLDELEAECGVLPPVGDPFAGGGYPGG